MRLWLVIILALFVYLLSCKPEAKPLANKEIKKYKRPLENVNRYLVKKDAELIKSYIGRRKLKMTESNTGLWYSIDQIGKGRKLESGNIAVIEYTLKLLDGTFCYSTDSLGPEALKLDYSEAEEGLQEGLLMMKKGDKAIFILPPHLAHGLMGDMEKIPPRSILVYDVELVDILN